MLPRETLAQAHTTGVPISLSSVSHWRVRRAVRPGPLRRPWSPAGPPGANREIHCSQGGGARPLRRPGRRPGAFTAYGAALVVQSAQPSEPHVHTDMEEKNVPTDAEELLLTLDQKVDPAHTALLVVDVQNDFLAEGGFFHQAGYDLSRVRAAVPPLKRLLEGARRAGVLVVFVQAIYDPEYLSGPMRERNLRRNLTLPRCISGTWGAEFFQVAPLPSEPVVVKHRYSAFAGTELDALLRRRGIRSLLLTGVTTDTCVESTARDAYFLDYYVILVADCCGALSEQDQRSALARADRDFATVAPSAEILQAWSRLREAASLDRRPSGCSRA
jgi:ureidoacrylate peracid hydrolase